MKLKIIIALCLIGMVACGGRVTTYTPDTQEDVLDEDTSDDDDSGSDEEVDVAVLKDVIN